MNRYDKDDIITMSDTAFDGKAGIVKFYATPDTFDDVIDILENMPFKVDILEEFCEDLM